ncbi:MAG: carboxymuconolactone decarboxylase family protein, partial [Chrysiogenetes bacterium]|nr:carboxymuconolactone decarboxylase family protein [Chrysiogenetes bacterium]
VMMMVRQILGVVPHAMGYFEIWPEAFTTYSVLVPSFLDIPRCDLGRGIPPDLRSLVLYVASRSYGCSYCSAHAAGVGTVFRGPGLSLARNREALNAEACGLFSPADIAAINYATAIAKIPGEVTLDLRLELARHHSEEHEEAIVLAATLMGFLNTAMDSLGMVLEWKVLEQAEKFLTPSSWTAAKNYEPEHDRDIIEADKLTDDGDTLGPLALARTMAGIIAYDRGALEGIPNRPHKIYEQVRGALGFVPYYLERIERNSTKRVIAHCLVERVAHDSGNVPVWIKFALGFIAAKRADNNLLAAHFAFGAVRAGATVKRLAEALRPGTEAGREQAAFDLAHTSSLAPADVGHAVVTALTQFWTPPSIIELIVALGVHGLLNRYTSTYPVDKYEPEIAAFVAEHGSALGIAAKPNGHGTQWDELAAKARAESKR